MYLFTFTYLLTFVRTYVGLHVRTLRYITYLVNMSHFSFSKLLLTSYSMSDCNQTNRT